MKARAPETCAAELEPVLELTGRVGRDPLLTQASTGNSSVKLDGVLWIKASGKWMADAMEDDILIPLDLAEVRTQCLRRNVDPADRYPGASVETAMHAALPHRVVVHAHCVNTIAWAVREDAPLLLRHRLEGLRWRWVPYVASGLPLSRQIEKALSADPGANIFVLGNHGLVVGGDDAPRVEALLNEVTRRLAIPPRRAHPAEYSALAEMSQDSPWDLPDDDAMHALGTDPASKVILARGLLYPCQAIFSDSWTAELFRPIPYPSPGHESRDRYRGRPFLIVDGHGVIVGGSMAPPELAMLSGLAQVVQRVDSSAPLHYLTEAEIAAISHEAGHHYRELAGARQRR